jgi:A/G-specific adenine glycosylase
VRKPEKLRRIPAFLLSLFILSALRFVAAVLKCPPMPHAKKPTPDSGPSTLPSLLLAWFAANARDLPWRRTRDPYGIWVSEIMLQQTQVKTVMPYWDRWMSELPTIASLANAKPEKIHKLWEGLGYYTRVRNMQKAAQFIERNHCGKFPHTFDEVLALSGIGRYTAGAICSIAFNQPTPILDGNVIRVLTRVFGIAENPKEKTANAQLWTLAEELVVHASCFTSHASPCSHLNQSLMELGALICTPREPKCLICPIAKSCFAFQNNRVGDFPNLEKRAAPTTRRFTAFVVENCGRFLVRQRPEGVVNAHLWEFPNLELNGTPLNPSAAAKELFGFIPKELKPLCTIKHSITRYRITVDAFCMAGESLGTRGARPSGAGVWQTLAELERLSFPSAHKKILKSITAEG